MFRLWGKIWKNNKMLQDVVITNNDNTLTRTKKVLESLNQVCYTFDLGVPIWLDTNITEFQRVSKTRFYKDNFIETISFDSLEIQVIEEDA